QTGENQQTSYARAKTLANLTGLVSQKRHAAPALDVLKVDPAGAHDNFGITGPKWGPDQATRLTGKDGKTSVVFAERDNRGKVYLYFSPEDATVGLLGVNGMGCVGLPDSIKVVKTGAKPEIVKLLSDGFRQRLFTRR
ncbi:phenylacetate-CoA oxygenase, partial [Burkholderia cenocepacia]|nr:phenylacetate-CoA oxygenase [Burkholderia cenocepacia]